MADRDDEVRLDVSPGEEFLVDRGIDLTIVDYRWGGTAQGWASYFGEEKVAQWLEEAQKLQQQSSR